MQTPTKILLASSVVLTYVSFTTFAGSIMSYSEIKSNIIFISKKVDLTNPLEALSCRDFVSFRRSMSADIGRQIVKLIIERELTTQQSQIGLHLLSGLPEQAYWDVGSPLLSKQTQADVLTTLLLQPLPYGPGYANSFKIGKYRQLLSKLSVDKAIAKDVKDELDLILSGRAAKIYRSYLKRPEQYGYPKMPKEK